MNLEEALKNLQPIEVDIEDGDIITDVIVLIRVQTLESTDDSLVIGSTPHTGGIVCHGILTSAVIQHELWMVQDHREDDE